MWASCSHPPCSHLPAVRGAGLADLPHSARSLNHRHHDLGFQLWTSHAFASSGSFQPARQPTGVPAIRELSRSSQLAVGGLLVLYGSASGQVPPFDLQRLSAMGSLFVTRPISLDYVRTHEELTAVTDAVFAMYQSGHLKVLVNPPYALKDARQAHMDLEGRGTTGKLVLSIGK